MSRTDFNKSIGRLAEVLKEKPTVITRANLWKIPHNSEKEDVRLKIGRYKKQGTSYTVESCENLTPKSELTLDDEEFKNLLKFLQNNYEPFKAGVKAFIPLDDPFNKENAIQIRQLFDLPDKKEIVNFILNHGIISEELLTSLKNCERIKAVNEFEEMLKKDLVETKWQKWFEINSWVLGTDFVRILDERVIDTQNISDFLMEAYDGFLDIVEIKRPEGSLQFWSTSKDHDNYIPHQDLIKSVTQASKYIYEVEREANSVKFKERVGGIKTIKPRCILLFGRSTDWDEEKRESYRILNSNYHNLSIMTYDHILERAKRIVGLSEIQEEENTAVDDVPF